MAIDFIVFGLDNVLFETEAAHLHSCNHAFEKCGLSHRWSVEQYRAAALAHGAAAATSAVTQKLGTAIDASDAAGLSHEKNRAFHNLACKGQVALHAGSARLIDEALEDGCKLAIVTDLPAHTATVLLEQAFNEKLTDMFSAIASGIHFYSPADNSAFHLVLRTVGADPWRSVAIESSVPGLLAAQRAGLWTLSAAPMIDDMDGMVGSDSWYPNLRAQKHADAKSGSFISLDELDALKNASRTNPTSVGRTAATWA